jgi:prolipoprotein diacylglyceryltransferase
MPLAYIPGPARAVWHLGLLPVRIQALFIVAGIVLAIVLAERRYRAAGGSPGVITDVAVWAVPAGLIPAALGAFLGPVHAGFWQGVRTWDEALGYPGAATLGALAAWAACRRMSGRWRFGRRRHRPASPTSTSTSSASAVPGTSASGTSARGTSARGSRALGRPGKRGNAARQAKRARQARSARPTWVGKQFAKPDRVRLTDVAGAVAPAMAFGYAVAELGSWAAQEGYGRPSSLWWAVNISPAHRVSGYENFATFQPVFLYQALWAVTTGIGLIWLTRRFTVTGDRAFAIQAAAYAAGGFAVFWLGIGHLPHVLGLRAGELGDVVVLVGAVVYLARTRRRRSPSLQIPHKSAMERDTPVM